MELDSQASLPSVHAMSQVRYCRTIRPFQKSASIIVDDETGVKHREQILRLRESSIIFNVSMRWYQVSFLKHESLRETGNGNETSVHGDVVMCLWERRKRVLHNTCQ